MRKIFTSLLLFAAFAVPTFATDYTGTLNVTIDGNSADPTKSTISIEKNADGTYKLSLHNFVLSAEGEEMAIGNIDIDNVAATTSGKLVSLKTSQSIDITAGDDDTKTWMGPLITGGQPVIPVEMEGTIYGDIFRTDITITFGGMSIKVAFCSDVFQILNSGFKDFHTAKYDNTTSDEPNNWHSFMSCSGSLASFVSGTPHTFTSSETRPGSTGKQSVKLTSGIVKVWLISTPANGTLTTGRLQAGAMSADDTKNCSFLNISSTDTDENGDPFYSILTGHPDSIKVWVKFKQGTLKSENAAYKYATMSAAITDGTYYQDPTDKTYTNIVATAKDNKIESKDFSWHEISIPFDYASYSSNNVKPKAILVTMSTNAQPGVGSTDSSNPDELYIDDLSLVYNAKLASLSVGGTAVTGFDKDTKTYSLTTTEDLTADDIVAVADGKGADVKTTLAEVDGGYTVTIVVTAEDLSISNTYTLNITKSGTGIKTLDSATDAAPTAIYTVEGKRVNSTNQKGLYIIKKADGTATKILKK